MHAALIGLITFAVALPVAMVLEYGLHKLSHNPDRNYKWGVYVFAALVAVWAALSNIGR